jgi:hypothetical protein
MPLARIDLRKGDDAAYRAAIGRVVYQAIVAVGVPQNDRFQVIAEQDANTFPFRSDLSWHRAHRRSRQSTVAASKPHADVGYFVALRDLPSDQGTDP